MFVLNGMQAMEIIVYTDTNTRIHQTMVESKWNGSCCDLSNDGCYHLDRQYRPVSTQFIYTTLQRKHKNTHQIAQI